MSAIGIVFQFSYRLHRHRWLGWSLARWLGLLLLATGLWTVFRYRSQLGTIIALGALFLAYLALMIWTDRQGYVRFHALADAQSMLHDVAPAPSLAPQEKVPLRASGWFTVEGADQYLVDVEADFETTGIREHIVLGRIQPSRFLLFGHWPKHEVGWWYIFFKPAMIRRMRLGHLYFGSRLRPALQVRYISDAEKERLVHFTFDDPSALRRVWDDLLRDVPPEAAA